MMEQTLETTADRSTTIKKAIDVFVCVNREQYSWGRFSISLQPIELLESGEGACDGQLLFNTDRTADDLSWSDCGYHKPMVFKNLREGKWRITYKSGSFSAIIFSDEFYIDRTNNSILCSYENRMFQQG